ncbi:hypothetical protein DBR06_SOUSAS3310079, partial [Sousa chinensis]
VKMVAGGTDPTIPLLQSQKSPSSEDRRNGKIRSSTMGNTASLFFFFFNNKGMNRCKKGLIIISDLYKGDPENLKEARILGDNFRSFIFSFPFSFLLSLSLSKIVWVGQECQCDWFPGKEKRKEQLAKWHFSYFSPHS